MATALIGLGANLGNPQATLRAVTAQLAAHPRIASLSASSVVMTEPVGGPAGQPQFANAVARVETDLSPGELLGELQAIENAFGRERQEHWAARTLDLDLLLYDDLQVNTAQLTLPHPRMAFRRFVLEPAVEVAADMVEPVTGWTLDKLLLHVNSPPRYIALSGTCWFAKQYVASAVAAMLNQEGIAAQASVTRGITSLGAAPYADPDHSFVDHFIDLMPRLAADLQQTLTTSPKTWLVASYWPGELAVSARLWFEGKALELAEAAYAEAFASFPAPKLLAAFHTPDEWLLFDPNELGHASAWYEHAQRLASQRDALEAQFDNLGGQPLLRLSAARPEAAIRELFAAVLAMK